MTLIQCNSGELKGKSCMEINIQQTKFTYLTRNINNIHFNYYNTDILIFRTDYN